MPGATSRLALPYPLLSDTADVPRDVTNLANAIDGAAVYAQAAQASRPVSAAGTPGIAGRIFYNTDLGIGAGNLQFDYSQGYRTIVMAKTDGNVDLGTAAQLQWSTDTYMQRVAANVLSTPGLLKALKGIYGGELTSAQRDALVAGARPRGTIIYNTDNARLEVNTGSDAAPVWSSVSGGQVASGTLAARPAYNAVNAPSMYYATDQDVTYINLGTAWQRSGSAQAGDLFLTMNTTAGVGRILLTGQAWPATTGIYADLYAKWSAKYPSNLPDWVGRMPVILGTHADINSIGKTEPANLAAANRRVLHKHTKNGTVAKSGTVSKTGGASLVGSVGFSDPTHTHGNTAGQPMATRYTNGSDQGSFTETNGSGADRHIGTASISGAYTGIAVNNGTLAVQDTIGVSDGISITDSITIGPQTGAEPVDGVAYLTCNIEANL